MRDTIFEILHAFLLFTLSSFLRNACFVSKQILLLTPFVSNTLMFRRPSVLTEAHASFIGTLAHVDSNRVSAKDTLNFKIYVTFSMVVFVFSECCKYSKIIQAVLLIIDLKSRN